VKGKKNKTSDAKSSHSPPANQCPDSPQEKVTLEKLTLHFIAEHNVKWHGISLWSVGVSCPSCVPPQPLAHPSQLSGAAQ